MPRGIRRITGNRSSGIRHGSGSEKRKQFYYHAFYKEQPDLNFRNQAVRDAMYDTMRFWLDKGVAGFRLDAVPSLFEDPQLRDEPYMEGMDAYGERKVSRAVHG